MGEHDYAEETLKPVKKAEEEKNADEPPEKRQKPDADAKKPQMETVVVKKHTSFVPLGKALNEFDWKAKENERQLKRLSETYPILRLNLIAAA